MKNILFIRGFGTDNIKTSDTYANIYIILSQDVNKIVRYFNYSPNEDIVKVYKRLCKVIKDNDFTHLVGHSMGGGLLMRYIYDHANDVSKYKQVILLMPLIYKIPFNKFFFNIPFVRNISVPNALVLPSSKAYSRGNILNDGFKLSKLKQVVEMYKEIMLESGEFVETLNDNRSNIVLFYANEEGYTPIPNSVLKKIKNKVCVDGLHECFNSLETVKEFFDKFLPYLE
jgi:pimeloyl-ACP methyl ester carboxylesterase